MQTVRYFSASWNDIKHSPGWFGKMCLLGLLSFIPIFGYMVVNGYLYGWAREIAWGVHEPMPTKIFGNEDGKLYRRGFYLLVCAFVWGIALALILWLIGMIPGMATVSTVVSYGSFEYSMVNYSMVYYIFYIVLSIVQSFIVWIGFMRISIYDHLSAGFQLGKIGKMYAHAPGGIWKIFGMNLLVTLIIFFVLGLVFSILLSLVLVGAISSAAMSFASSASISSVIQILVSAGPALLLIMLAMLYVFMVAFIFVSTLIARALGYWTYGFDVPHWRSQDELMPFEDTSA